MPVWSCGVPLSFSQGVGSPNQKSAPKPMTGGVEGEWGWQERRGRGTHRQRGGHRIQEGGRGLSERMSGMWTLFPWPPAIRPWGCIRVTSRAAGLEADCQRRHLEGLGVRGGTGDGERWRRNRVLSLPFRPDVNDRVAPQLPEHTGLRGRFRRGSRADTHPDHHPYPCGTLRPALAPLSVPACPLALP